MRSTQRISAEAKVKHVFIFDHEEHQRSGEALASLDWMKNPRQPSVRNFPKNTPKQHRFRKTQQDGANCFNGMQKEDFQHMVFLGHSNTETYADYDANEFVEKLETHFMVTGFDKSIVGRLDLIGCELGFIDKNGMSLAQKIADRLKKRGFINATVHAIASPSQAAGQIVEVQSGMAYIGKPQPGSIHAYLLDSEEKAALDEALESGMKPTAAINEAIGKQPIYFLHGADPVKEFAKAENTFIGGEKPKARLKRIQQDPDFQRRQLQSEEKQEALALITERLAHIKEKLKDDNERNNERSKKIKQSKITKRLIPNKRVRAFAGDAIEKVVSKEQRLTKLAENLDLLRIAVEKSDPESWQSTIGYNLPRFHTVFMVREKVSKTYRLLERLAKADLNEAEEIVANQDSPGKEKGKEKKRDKEVGHRAQASSLPPPSLTIPTWVAKTRKKSDESPQASDSYSGNNVTAPKPVKTQNTSESHKRAQEFRLKYGLGDAEKLEEAREEVKLGKAIEEINTLIGLLELEIAALNRKCLSWLCFSHVSYEIHTKIQKQLALQSLIEGHVGNFESLQKRAAAITDSRVFRGAKVNQLGDEWVKNRTGALINRIIKQPESFEYEAPAKKATIN